MKPKPKWQLKVLFIFIEMQLSKKVIKRDNWLLLSNKTQKWYLNVLFIFREMRLSKKWLKNRLDFYCEVKAKMIFESNFHSPWIATFKEGHEIGQFDSCIYCKAKQKWRPFHFIELWLSKITTLDLESKAKITHESSLQFIGLRLNSSHNRKSTD